MIDPFRRELWLWRALFVGIFLLALFLRLLPIQSEAGRWPAPDFLLALTFAWVLRRPDHLPALLIALVFLVEDLLFLRPPGLWAALVLMATEFLRSRAVFSREIGLAAEWLMVAVVIVVMTLACRLVLFAAMVPQPGLMPVVAQMAGTILVYPFVVAAARLALGLRKPATGELDQRGRRL